MLDLKDLDIISDEEARFNEFLSQFDYYVLLLWNYRNSDIFSANCQTRQMRFRAWFYKRTDKTVAEHFAKLASCELDKTYKFINICADEVKNCYSWVKKMYPNFDEFISSIANMPSMEQSQIGDCNTIRQSPLFDSEPTHPTQ